jgi:hypothetical protein
MVSLYDEFGSRSTSAFRSPSPFFRTAVTGTVAKNGVFGSGFSTVFTWAGAAGGASGSVDESAVASSAVPDGAGAADAEDEDGAAAGADEGAVAGPAVVSLATGAPGAAPQPARTNRATVVVRVMVSSYAPQ